MKLLITIFLLVSVFQVASAKKDGKNFDVKHFQNKITSSNTVVVDVRTPSEFAEGHISGAILIDVLDKSFEKNITALSKKRTICVYCRSGNRSGKAVKLLIEKKYRKVINLIGGIKAWKNAGKEVVQ